MHKKDKQQQDRLLWPAVYQRVKEKSFASGDRLSGWRSHLCVGHICFLHLSLFLPTYSFLLLPPYLYALMPCLDFICGLQYLNLSAFVRINSFLPTLVLYCTTQPTFVAVTIYHSVQAALVDTSVPHLFSATHPHLYGFCTGL